MERDFDGGYPRLPGEKDTRPQADGKAINVRAATEVEPPPPGNTQRRCWTHDGNGQCRLYNGHEDEHDFGITEQHQPGDNHNYRITCVVCGQRGQLVISVAPAAVPGTETEETVPE